MKAVVLHKNAYLSYQDWELAPPNDDEVTVQVKACGVCSSDIYRGFENGAYFYPLIMGHELAGTIVAKGTRVSGNLQLGDQASVFPLLPCFACISCEQKKYAQCHRYSYYGSRCHGGYAEYVNVKSWNILPVPKTVRITNAAALEPISVVLHALSRIDLSQHREVAILGAGFLGLIAVKILQFRQPQLKITMIDRNDFKLEIAAQHGADALHISDDKSWEKLLKDRQASYSAVIECCGSASTFRHSLNLCSRHGHVVWMGNIASDLNLPMKEVSAILRKEISIIGSWNSHYKSSHGCDWQEALQLLEKGFCIDSLLSKQIPLAAVPEELSNLYAHKKKTKYYPAIKVMIKG